MVIDFFYKCFRMFKTPYNMTAGNNQEALLRDRIFGNLSKMFESVPNATYSLWSAAHIGTISEELLMHTYQDITTFLNEYPQYARIILYLPFELLPHFEQATCGKRLHAHAESFVAAYKKALRGLLAEHDTKALFVDGDVPEPELGFGAGPIVSKAAQLIPELFFWNLITESEIEEMLCNQDPTALESLKEVAAAIKVACATPVTTVSEESQTGAQAHIAPMSIAHVIRLAKREAAQLDEKYAIESSTLTPSRAKWLKEKRLTRFITELAHHHRDTIDPKQYLGHDHEIISRIGIASLANQSEQYLRSALSTPRKKIVALLLTKWATGSSSVRHDLQVFIAHMVARKYLSAHEDIVHTILGRVPCFEQFWNGEMPPHAMDVLTELTEATWLIEDTELGNYLYPITIVYGSHFKGYGMYDSDVDIACIVKPGVPFEKEEYIQGLIRQQFGDTTTQNTLLFWTKQDSNGIEVIPVFDVPLNPRFVGDMMQAHILLQAHWIGRTQNIQSIQSEIRKRYAEMRHAPLRALWIRALEHDVLQYRLLHKGYAYLFPKQVPEQYVAFETDGSFWDSGFRRLATLLYLKKVTLPN